MATRSELEPGQLEQRVVFVWVTEAVATLHTQSLRTRSSAVVDNYREIQGTFLAENDKPLKAGKERRLLRLPVVNDEFHKYQRDSIETSWTIIYFIYDIQ